VEMMEVKIRDEEKQEMKKEENKMAENYKT
jgi:hypothetical protein